MDVEKIPQRETMRSDWRTVAIGRRCSGAGGRNLRFTKAAYLTMPC